MNAIKHLPPDYRLAWTIDLAKNRRLLVILNIFGIALFVPALLLFGRLITVMRPDLGGPSGVVLGLGEGSTGTLLQIAGIFIAYVLVLLLHEGFHGIFFWAFTGKAPEFAFKLSYAFAAAPTWFIPRRQYWIVALAPLVGVSAVGIAMLPLLPEGWILAWLIALSGNVAGAVGDLYVLLRLWGAPANTLVNDRGDAISFYHHD